MDRAKAALALFGLAFSIGTGWWYGRKFLFHYRVSSYLRSMNALPLEDASKEAHVGSYVLIRGIAKPLSPGNGVVSPNSKTKCLYYILTKRHVIENIKTTTSSGTIGAAKLVPDLFKSKKGMDKFAWKSCLNIIFRLWCNGSNWKSTSKTRNSNCI
jgi:hypothetical protein